MPDSHALFLFLFSSLILAITPGPDLLYITTRGAAEGRASGVIAALGVGAGIVVHTVAAALGLAGLLFAIPGAFTAIKLAGAVYLIYLGARILLAAHDTAPQARLTLGDWKSAFLQGALTNILNPKVALFFLAFLPQFVDPRAGALAWQFILLGLLFNVVGTAFNVLVALCASWVSRRLRGQYGKITILRKTEGGAFVLLGIYLAFAQRK
jgi:threonine/homoserine/homoserine lactone efflux protein